MLISPDLSKVILTPTKTGTKSFESAFQHYGWEKVMPRHARRVPKHLQGKVAIALPIRNPYDRLRSMYTFGLQSKHTTLLRWAHPNGLTQPPSFKAFLDQWCAEMHWRKPIHLDWTSTYSDYLRCAQQECAKGRPVVLMKLENGIPAALRLFGLPPIERHVNSSSKAKPPETKFWTKDNVSMVRKLLQEDLELGDYSIPNN